MRKMGMCGYDYDVVIHSRITLFVQSGSHVDHTLWRLYTRLIQIRSKPNCLRLILLLLFLFSSWAYFVIALVHAYIFFGNILQRRTM